MKRTNDSAFTPAFTVRKLVRWAKAEMFVESHPDIQTLARRKPSRIVGVEVVRRPRLLLLAHVWQQCEHPTPALALATCRNATTVRVNAGWMMSEWFVRVAARCRRSTNDMPRRNELDVRGWHVPTRRIGSQRLPCSHTARMATQTTLHLRPSTPARSSRG